MPQQIPQVPLGTETQRLKTFCFFHCHMLHPLRRIGPERIRGGALQHLSHRQETDQRQESINQDDHNPAESRSVKRP